MRQAVAKCSSNGMEVGISIGNRKVTDLDYADDIALLTDNEAALQSFVDQVVFFGAMLGLKINADKTKVMAACTTVAPRINVQGTDVESVDSFRYLGCLISNRNSCESDILSRICLAQAAYQLLHPCLFAREDVSIPTKMRVYLASVRSVLVYGCESWTVTSSLSSTLDSCEFGFLRRLLGVKSFPFPRNSEVLRRCGIHSSLSQFVKRS